MQLPQFMHKILKVFFACIRPLRFLIWEILQALFAKISWKIVLERFLTRLVVELLKWLRDLSSNQLVNTTLEDILNELRGKGLREAKISSLLK